MATEYSSGAPSPRREVRGTELGKRFDSSLILSLSTLRSRCAARDEIERRVRQAAGRVGLSDMLARPFWIPVPSDRVLAFDTTTGDWIEEPGTASKPT